jgi:hypothetical protein
LRPDLFQQRIEHQAGIADQADPGLDILVEMVGIERRMNDGLALRHPNAERGFGERAADAEDHIGLAEEFWHRARHRDAPRSERQRMRLREGRLAAKTGANRYGEPFGQLLQLGPGPGVMHALAGIDHGPLGGHEQGCRFLHMHRVGAVAGAQHRGVIQGLRHFLVPHVGRDFDDHRPAAAVLQFCKRAAEDVADFGCDIDRLGRFGERPHRLAGVEVRVDIGEPARIAHWQHQHGNGFAVTLRDTAHGVFGAGPVLHAERADAPARRDAGDCVRHVDADAFLPHHHRADVGIGGELDQVIDRIAAEDLDALALHDFRDRGAKLHDGLSPWFSGRFSPADLHQLEQDFPVR